MGCRCHWRVEILKNEGLGFLKPLSSGVAASGGSKSANNQDIGFVKPLFSGVVASGGSKSSNIEGLGFFF